MAGRWPVNTSSVRGRAPDQLLARLAENESVLVAVHTLITEALAAERQITPAGEWLLDNYYLIEEQIRTAKRHLPKAYSRELPRLLHGPSAGLPRVYDIALEIISHGDGRVDPESLTSFVAAYQTETPLTLGELWALPIMLRLALIENLRRVSARIAGDRISRNRADTWADQLTETATKDPKNLIVAIADMARSNPPMDSAFVAELTRRLQGQGSALVLPLTWIEQRLAETGWTIQQMVQSENQKQAADQVSMSNSIGSLRYLSALDWRKFVETMSRGGADAAAGRWRDLRQDGIRHSRPVSPRGGADRQIQRTHGTRRGAEGDRTDARWHAAAKASERETHVGFYLIGEGVDQLERAVETRFPIGERLGQSLPQIARAAVRGRHRGNHAGAGRACLRRRRTAARWICWVLAAFGVLWLIAASQFGVSLVNWLATLLATPHMLPRMDFSEGIPPEYRTLVVVPSMLASAGNVEELVEALEVRFLANRDENLYFGLLTDFRDADEEVLPEDESLLRTGEAGNRRSQHTIQVRRQRAVFSVSPPAALESPGAPLDGLRAQARQAGRLECAVAQRLDGRVFTDRRRYQGAGQREVCDHAGHRHAAAARCRARTGGRHGAPVESRGILRAGGARLRGVRHPAAESRREPARRQPVASTRACLEASPGSTLTRAPSRMCTRTCSARVPSSARGSTMWMPSSARSRGASRTTAF